MLILLTNRNDKEVLVNTEFIVSAEPISSFNPNDEAVVYGTLITLGVLGETEKAEGKVTLRVKQTPAEIYRRVREGKYTDD